MTHTCICGSKDFYLLRKNGKQLNQVGIYCEKCNRWLKWADKYERLALMKERAKRKGGDV